MTDAEIPPGKIRQYRALKTTQAYLDKTYGAGNWGDEEVAAYIRQKQAEKAGRRTLEAAAERIGVTPPDALPQDFDARLRQYILSYEGITPNDLTSFRTLVTLDMQIEKLQRQLVETDDVLVQTKIGDSVATLSREHRQLQDSMGIARAKRKAETNAQDEVNRLRDGARAFVEKLGVEIKCQHCRSDFQMGWLLFHFRDDTPWRFSFTCPNPKCGRITEILGTRVVDATPQLEGVPF